MPSIIIIEKDGIVREHNLKDPKLNEETLYKKIGLKTGNNFERIYNDTYNGILLYGKKTGKPNCINKYPFDTLLPESLKGCVLFGSCILLKLVTNDSTTEDTACQFLNDFKLADFSKFIEKSTCNSISISPPISTPPFNEIITLENENVPNKTEPVVLTPTTIEAAVVSPTIASSTIDEELKEEEYVI
jgi:hypothetical protein